MSFEEQIARFDAHWAGLVATATEPITGVVRLDLGDSKVVTVTLTYDGSGDKCTEVRLARHDDLRIVREALVYYPCCSDEDDPDDDLGWYTGPVDPEMSILKAVWRNTGNVAYVRLPCCRKDVWEEYRSMPHSWPVAGFTVDR